MKTKFWAGRTGDTLPTNPEDLPRSAEKVLCLAPLACRLWEKCAISISEKQYSSIRMDAELNDGKRISCLVADGYLFQACFAMAEKLAAQGITIDDISAGKISVHEYSPQGNSTLFTRADEPNQSAKGGRNWKEIKQKCQQKTK